MFWLTAAAVLVLALVPPQTPVPTTGWDKVNHALAFVVLAIQGGLCWRWHVKRVMLGLLVYGAVIEALQSLTPARSAEWLDVLADAVGLAIGWMALRLIAARKQAKQCARSATR